MNRTLTLVLAIVFLALIGAALWLDQPREATPTPELGTVTPTLGPIWSINTADLTELRFEDLKNKDASALDLRKDMAGNWALYGMLPGDSRLSREANQETITSPISQLAILSPTLDLGEELDLATFGLDQTGFLLTLKMADGKSYLLEIGRDPTPTKSGYYAKLQGTLQVFVIPASVMDPLFGFLIAQPMLATVTPPSATATAASSGTTPTGTIVLTTATAISAP